jgi:hypothetical protein
MSYAAHKRCTVFEHHLVLCAILESPLCYSCGIYQAGQLAVWGDQ